MFKVDMNDQTVTISLNGRSITLHRAVYDVFASLDKPTPNKIVQERLADVLRLPLAGGKNARAGGLIEKYCSGYAAFNGFCALITLIKDGKSSFFEFNPSYEVSDVPTKSIERRTAKLVQIRHKVPTAAYLDLPDNDDASAESMNLLIDLAYRRLGFDPHNLIDEAPDLTYSEALEICCGEDSKEPHDIA